MRRLSIILLGLLTAAALTIPLAASAQTGVTVHTETNLNLRSGPGVQFPIVGTVYAGSTLPAAARSWDSSWVRVVQGSQYGWVAEVYLQVSGSLASLPVGDGNSTPGPALPTIPPVPPDGSIASLDLYVSTANANYYRLTYWSDGLLIKGFYAEPKSPGPHAAVIYNRGGNRDTGALTGVELGPLAEVGFVVVASQFRGGGGSQGVSQFGGDDLHDVTNLIPLLKSRPAVDPDRIVMIGGSSGGMMTYLALEAQTLRGTHDIKAAVTVSGLADLISWGKERPDITTPFYLEMFGALPDVNPAPYVARSAVDWPWRIRVPIQLEHGDADDTVSVQQSEHLYSQLRYYGDTANLIIYPGGQHGLGNYLGGLPDAFHWFQTYVGKPGDTFDWDAHQDDIRTAIIALDKAK